MAMNIIADLQLHSKYSRAVSKHMDVSEIMMWAKKKGIDLVATGDWMHPIWFRELQNDLEELDEGIFGYKGDKDSGRKRVKFLLSAEISSIYTQGGKGRRVHTLVFSPSFSVAENINTELVKRGCNLSSDGRPIVGLSAQAIAEIALSMSDRCLVIPAHAWTPWFSLYGSKSGFDSVEECFGEYAKYVYAVETGLSSDPAMNWRIDDLSSRAIVSFSDAHSGAKLGREATVFQVKNEPTNDQLSMINFSYNDIYWAIAERFLGKNEGSLKISHTIEFHPEEGKYHYTGHRKCQVIQSPEETRRKGTTCHVCGRSLTVGVMSRVEELARSTVEPLKKVGKHGVVSYIHPNDKTRPGYVMLVPLLEILSEVYQVGVGSKKVKGAYDHLIAQLSSEFHVLLQADLGDISRVGGERLAEAIEKNRTDTISIQPGYDGVFGTVKMWPSLAQATEARDEQISLF